MAWDFCTEPEFEEKLAWIRQFVRDEVEPLEVLFPGCEFLPPDDERRAACRTGHRLTWAAGNRLDEVTRRCGQERRRAHRDRARKRQTARVGNQQPLRCAVEPVAAKLNPA